MQGGDGSRKERLTGIAGLWGMEECRAGRRKQKAQLRRRWRREVRAELDLRENQEPRDAQPAGL